MAQDNRSSIVPVIVAWLVVGLPAAWGVQQTIYKSLPLFTAPVVATTAPASMPSSAVPAR